MYMYGEQEKSGENVKISASWLNISTSEQVILILSSRIDIHVYMYICHNIHMYMYKYNTRNSTIAIKQSSLYL